MKSWVCAAASLALAGCVSTQPAALGAARIEQVREKNYELGQPMTAVVGDVLIRSKDYRQIVRDAPALEATEDFVVSGGGMRQAVGKGARMAVVGEREVSGVPYRVVLAGTFGLQASPSGEIRPKVVNYAAAVPVEMVWNFTISPPSARLVPITETKIEMGPTDQNFELLFNGLDGQAMRLQYREYTAEDLARAAFHQDLSYPVGTRTIRFRRLAIDVESVSPEQINYRVVADGRAD